MSASAAVETSAHEITATVASFMALVVAPAGARIVSLDLSELPVEDVVVFGARRRGVVGGPADRRLPDRKPRKICDERVLVRKIFES